MNFTDPCLSAKISAFSVPSGLVGVQGCSTTSSVNVTGWAPTVTLPTGVNWWWTGNPVCGGLTETLGYSGSVPSFLTLSNGAITLNPSASDFPATPGSYSASLTASLSSPYTQSVSQSVPFVDLANTVAIKAPRGAHLKDQEVYWGQTGTYNVLSTLSGFSYTSTCV